MSIIIDRFERELIRSEASVDTIAAYKSDLKKFHEYIRENVFYSDSSFDESLCAITYEVLEDFIYWLEDREYSRATINRMVASLKAFYKYYSKHSGFNPAIGLKGYKNVNSKRRAVLSKEQVIKIINQTQIKRYGEPYMLFNAQRNRFLIALLATTGLRIGEALNIKFGNIEHYDRYKMVNIDIHKGKTKLNKRVPICEKILPYYDSYIEEYEKKFEVSDEKYLIVAGRSGEQLCSKSSNVMIKKYCKELEIEDVTNHCFRHYANTSLEELETPDSIRKKILGWSCNGDMGNSIYSHDTEKKDKIMAKYCNKILE